MYCEGKFAYEELFSNCLYSYEVGIKKPNKEIFKKLLKQMHEKAENCLFIDDSLENIYAAKQLGFTTIQFTNATQLRTDLENLSIRLAN